MSERKRKWHVREPNDWERQTRRLPLDVLKKLRSVIDELTTLEDPTVFGVYEKNLKYGSAYVLKLSKSHRLSYQVDFTKKIIILNRVGDHKAVGSKE
jgi:mRNA-degrading endonuclease RelE of RelBE toxin-antitoxin system